MATLKISDLSVGDWAHHDLYESDMRVVTIYGDTEWIEAEISSGRVVRCHLKHFTPIPITAEILEKNGFGKKTFTQDQLFRIVEPNGNMPFIGYRWDSRRVIIERDNDYMLRVKAEYIHQLQHALRLAGVDKEINL